MTDERQRVLVVDDEKSVRDLLERVLKGAGYDVVTAANGQEALNKVSELKIESILMDIRMPGMSGMEVLQQLTINYPGTSVIMVTAVGDAQTAVKAIKLGAYDYIIKPFNQDDLILTVQRAIEKGHLLLENERYRLDLENKVGEQTRQLEQQFVELVETLAREHKLIYRLASHDSKQGKEALSKLPKELREPMNSVEEFSEALIRILRRGALKPSYRTSADGSKDSKR